MSAFRFFGVLKNLSSRRIFISPRRCYQDLSNDKISYQYGATNEPLINLTVPEMLLRSVSKNPDKVCVISHHESLIKTYQDLQSDSNKLAASLSDLGIKRFDKLGIWSSNCYSWIVTQFASSKIGAILVNINPGYQESELEYCVNLAGVKIIIAGQRYKSTNYVNILGNLRPDLIYQESSKSISSLRKIPSLEKVVFLDSDKDSDNIAQHSALKFSDLLSNSSYVGDHFVDEKITFDDAINVQFTSGTTGAPKGATLTHFNIINNAHSCGKLWYQNLPSKKVCVPNPLYHCFGSVNGSLQIVIHSGTIILPNWTATPGTTLDAIQKYEPDMIYGTPTMFVDMLNYRSNDKKYDHVEKIIMSGAPCPTDVIDRLKSELFPNFQIIIPYGCTETSPVITSTDPMTHRTEYLSNTVGKVMPHVEVKIANPDNGDVLPINTTGELMTRGYLTFKGYYNQNEATRTVLDDNKWYHTGDIAIMNEEGYISIIGRNKDMIIRGGENIYPRELEDFILKHNPDLVADVNVVGVPDKRMGEEICAVVILKDSQNDNQINKDKIKDSFKGKVAHFKTPKYVLFMDEFPRTVTMKVQKNKLKILAEEILSKEKNSS